MDLPWYVTAETTFDAGGYTYGFDERGADGGRYVVIAQPRVMPKAARVGLIALKW